jgi:hypothetical protein
MNHHRPRHRPKTLALSLALALLLVTATIVGAQSSTQFDLSRHVLAGGGRPSASASYRVNGTVGQGLAGPPAATSAGFRLSSGYWVARTLSVVYLPLVIRQ